MKPAPITDDMTIQRHRMIDRLRDHYHITDTRVLDAMSYLPRHSFVPAAIRPQAYNDNALLISSGQTISQPFIVARMTELLELSGKEKVLEIGAGSGYQTAILASLARKVFAIERLPHLADQAKLRLSQLGLRNVTLKSGDGTKGWDAYKPFDAILAEEKHQPIFTDLIGERGKKLLVAPLTSPPQRTTSPTTLPEDRGRTRRAWRSGCCRSRTRRRIWARSARTATPSGWPTPCRRTASTLQ